MAGLGGGLAWGVGGSIPLSASTPPHCPILPLPGYTGAVWCVRLGLNGPGQYPLGAGTRACGLGWLGLHWSWSVPPRCPLDWSLVAWWPTPAPPIPVPPVNTPKTPESPERNPWTTSHDTHSGLEKLPAKGERPPSRGSIECDCGLCGRSAEEIEKLELATESD